MWTCTGIQFSLLSPPSAQACRRIQTTVVARKLKAAGLVAFSGKLRPSTEPLAAPALTAPRLPLSPRKADSSRSR
jgi:hypothetical protein